MAISDDREFRFARHQKLPPGYAVIWSPSDEMCRWRFGEDTYSDPTWSKWACWRGAWLHYRAEAGRAALRGEEVGK